jgi:hypothetical protein
LTDIWDLASNWFSPCALVFRRIEFLKFNVVFQDRKAEKKNIYG